MTLGQGESEEAPVIPKVTQGSCAQECPRRSHTPGPQFATAPSLSHTLDSAPGRRSRSRSLKLHCSSACCCFPQSAALIIPRAPLPLTPPSRCRSPRA